MSATTNCACPCPTPEIVTVPGAPGTDGTTGTAGTNGINAYTTTTTPTFNLPGAPGPTGLINVAVSSWMAIDQIIIISDPTVVGNLGHFQVLTIPSSTGVTLQWLQYPTDAVPGTPITSGSQVSPAGVFTQAAPLPTAITYTGISAAPVSAVNNLNIQAGVGMSVIGINHTWIGGTAAAESATNFIVGFKFRIVSWAWITDFAITGGGGSRVANLEINATDVGTVPSTCTVTTAGAATPGAVVVATAVAGANTGTATDTISVEIAAGGTALTAGGGQWMILIQNMDTADSVAHLSEAVNNLITALT